MKRKFLAAGGIATIAVLTLAGCSGNNDSTGGETLDPDAEVELTLSGWSLDTTPEFQVLADAFMAHHDNVTITLTEYDSADYNTLVTADLAAGAGPDLITQKEVKYVTTFQEGGQLLDVSDVSVGGDVSGIDSYTVDGTAYAIPYRQDSWVLYYNKDLFAEAGVAEPDGSWTWDDYEAAANAIASSGAAKGAYHHGWQSVVQGFANAQSGVSPLEGTYGHLADYYQRTLDLQDSGAIVDFNTVGGNSLTYQGEFGTQKAAMLPMGTWFTATLISQQASGEANDFEWGIAPIPQQDASTAGTDNTPVTFGDPTAIGINANIDSDKIGAAKAFLEFIASEDAAKALAEIGITPSLTNDAVVESYFAVEGAPGDDLSKFAWSTGEVIAENPTSSDTAAIQNILGDLHSAILSGSDSIDDAIAEAEDRVANEVG